jgi:hypothetical protein
MVTGGGTQDSKLLITEEGKFRIVDGVGAKGPGTGLPARKGNLVFGEAWTSEKSKEREGERKHNRKKAQSLE